MTVATASSTHVGEALPPAGVVASMREQVSALTVDGLTDRERLDLVAELERFKHTAAATQARATHALRRSREVASPQDAVRSVGAEVALARRESPTLCDRYVGLARALVTEMPCTLGALDAGACSERHAVAMAQVTSVLSVADRGEVDRRVGPLLGRLGVRGAEQAARRVASELDAATVVRRMEAAVASRRVTVRPAPDGMAYLTVLGPMVEVVGAHAALRARARSVVGGVCADEAPAGRSPGAVAADTALRLMSGRSVGESQPVEVHLVMTDHALLGTGDHQRSTMEPARVPGHGSVPAPVARALLRGEGGGDGRGCDDGSGGTVSRPVHDDHGAAATVWLRRLYTSPDGRDLVAMDSRRRAFTGLLRRMLVLRDDVCRTPWCEAAIAHADHATPARSGGATDLVDGNGRCARCHYTKEAPGWLVAPTRTSPPGPTDRQRTRHELQVRTPLGRRYASQAPPLLGWGSHEARAAGSTEPAGCGQQHATVTSRAPGRRRAEVLDRASVVVLRRPRSRSRSLVRELGRRLT
jgi:hypothetical protein